MAPGAGIFVVTVSLAAAVVKVQTTDSARFTFVSLLMAPVNVTS